MAQTKYKIVIDAVNRASKVFRSVQKGLAKVGAVAKGMTKILGGVGLAVAAVGAAFIAMGKKAFDTLDSIGKTATRTGFAAETLQALRLGAVESGSSVEALNKAIEKFSKNIGDVIVKGTGEATYALDRMGITLYDNEGILKSNDQILREVTEGIKNMSSEVERNSALQGFFGRQGILMNQVFADGVRGLDLWISKAREMGFVVNGEAIKSVENFNDRFSELKFMISGLVNQTFAALAPGLEEQITKFKDWAVETAKAKGGLEDIGKTIASTLVEKLAAGLEGIGVFADSIEKFAVAVKNNFYEVAIAVSTFADSIPFTADQTENIANLQSKLSKATGQAGRSMKVAAQSVRALGKGILEANKPTEDLDNKLEDSKGKLNGMLRAAKAFGSGFKDIMISSSKGLDDFRELGEKVAMKLESGLTDAFMNIGKGLDTIRDLADAVLKMIVQEMIRIAIVKPFLAGIGFAAEGGTVGSGKPYIVGERGPELFVPATTGAIVPNDRLGGVAGGGDTNVNVTFEISSWDSRDTLEAITQQAPAIVGIVDRSFRKHGRRGPLGL